MLASALVLISALGFEGEIPNAKPTPTTDMPTVAVAPKLELHAVEAQVIRYTNSERAKYGLPPLEVDDSLVRSARGHATWMTTRQTLRHTNKPVGENIAYGQSSPREVVGDWMRSAGHRANILSRGYRKIGVAAFVARNGRIYWCQQFLR